MSKNELRHSIVATDIVLFSVLDGELKVFLVEVVNKEYSGKLAFPGGLILVQENAPQAVHRVIKQKVGIDTKDVYIEELGAYSEVNRDKRGRVVSIAYLGFINPEKIIRESDNFKLVNYKKIKGLAYDHDLILKDSIEKLRELFLNSTVAQKLLKDNFTLGELLGLYNLVLDREVDKRNFNKKIKSLNIIKDTKKLLKGMKNRPAKLYEFKDKVVKKLEIF